MAAKERRNWSALVSLAICRHLSSAKDRERLTQTERLSQKETKVTQSGCSFLFCFYLSLSHLSVCLTETDSVC